MRRTVTPEWLDVDLGTPEEIAASLADLRRINRWLGGVRTMRKLVEAVAQRLGRRSLTVLDVGAGSGEWWGRIPGRLVQCCGSSHRLQVPMLTPSLAI